ncbi:MAG: hypothetical protein D6729_12345, partial [Deltaproteobacteria bacterium]
MSSAEVLVFQAGGRRLAVPVASLIAVAPTDGVTPLPLTGPEVLGLMLHAGTLLPLLDPLRLTGLGALKKVPALAVVVDGGGEAVGLGCQRVEGTAPGHLGDPLPEGVG